MVALVAFGDQIRTREPRVAKCGAIIGGVSHGTMQGQPRGGDVPSGFGVCTLWGELEDED